MIQLNFILPVYIGVQHWCQLNLSDFLGISYVEKWRTSMAQPLGFICMCLTVHWHWKLSLFYSLSVTAKTYANYRQIVHAPATYCCTVLMPLLTLISSLCFHPFLMITYHVEKSISSKGNSARKGVNKTGKYVTRTKYTIIIICRYVRTHGITSHSYNNCMICYIR
jgi:hypothetical protein